MNSFKIWLLIISWALFEPRFLIICSIPLLEKWQLTIEFSASKVNCDVNTLKLVMGEHSSVKKELKISLFSLNSTMY